MKRYRYLFFISHTTTSSQLARRILKASLHLYVSRWICWNYVDPLVTYIEDQDKKAIPVCAVLIGGDFLEYCKHHPIHLPRKK